MSNLRGMWAIVKKDVITEIRNKDAVVAVILFAFIVIVVMAFSFGVDRNLIEEIAPGTLWVAFTFGGIMGLARSFVHEKEESRMEGLLASPIPREYIYGGKFLSNLLFTLIVLGLMLPLFEALMNVHVITSSILYISLLASIGFCAAGTLFSALAVNTRAREIALPLLFLPIVVPLLISAVKATDLALSGEPFVSWSNILIAFDLVFLALPFFLFNYVVED